MFGPDSGQLLMFSSVSVPHISKKKSYSMTSIEIAVKGKLEGHGIFFEFIVFIQSLGFLFLYQITYSNCYQKKAIVRRVKPHSRSFNFTLRRIPCFNIIFEKIQTKRSSCVCWSTDITRRRKASVRIEGNKDSKIKCQKKYSCFTGFESILTKLVQREKFKVRVNYFRR